MIEVLVSLAVSGMLLAGLVTAIFQTTTVTGSNSSHIAALEDIKNVARRITIDVRMANTTNLVSESPAVYDNLVLDWTSWYDSNGQLSPVDRRLEYTLLSGGRVQRNYDPDTSVGGNESIATMGRYISDMEFSRQGSVVTVTITSSPQGKPETAEQMSYRIALQPKEELVQ